MDDDDDEEEEEEGYTGTSQLQVRVLPMSIP